MWSLVLRSVIRIPNYKVSDVEGLVVRCMVSKRLESTYVNPLLLIKEKFIYVIFLHNFLLRLHRWCRTWTPLILPKRRHGASILVISHNPVFVNLWCVYGQPGLPPVQGSHHSDSQQYSRRRSFVLQVAFVMTQHSNNLWLNRTSPSLPDISRIHTSQHISEWRGTLYMQSKCQNNFWMCKHLSSLIDFKVCIITGSQIWHAFVMC